MIKLKKGLCLPIEGQPEQKIYDGAKTQHVALIGADIVGMKPSMSVNVGDKVKLGQVVYTDKKTPNVNYTAPAAGTVVAINRGDKRVFESLVIKVEGDDCVRFSSYKGADVQAYSEEEIKRLLLESGMWPSLKARPFSKVADPAKRPSSIFITAIDTHPLAADPVVVCAGQDEAFKAGLNAMGKLTDKVYLCTAPGANIPGKDLAHVLHEEFAGPHPAGLVGTHIHYLDPVSEKKTVWHTNYQEVIAIGKLFLTGKLYNQRVISIGGPVARNPRLIRTQVGASISELVKDEIFESAEFRKVSGSLFGGRSAEGTFDYLGRFHHQVVLLKEGREREFLGWHRPGLNKFSVKPVFISKLIPKKFAFTTTTNGSLRSIVPIGSFEKVMPLDIEPTYLLRSLMAKNTEMSAKLGALELDEEDLSLCTFVDPCKNDYAIALRENLTIIEKEG